MEIKLLLFLYSISLVFSSAISTTKIKPRFPSSIVAQQPENKLSLSSKTELYEEKFFTQILDHFNFHPQSYQTFQQRYLINDKYWGGPNNNSPIFVYTGNEGEIEWFAQNTGFLFDTAPLFKALLIFIEHRFYGKSIPFGATDSPVVVFGGSYGGMLAAWFRLKYPHVAIGALASSAPILNFENITSPYSFNNIITHDFRSESENCYKVIKGSWQEIEETAAKSGGSEILRKAFRICKNNTSLGSLGGWLETAYVYTAMTDYPTPSNFLNPLPAYPVKQMCKAIDDPKTGNNTFEKLYGAANIYYNYSGDATCFNLDDNSDPHGLGGWTWQACTEMILPTDGNNAESIFPESVWNYNDRAEYCKNGFNIEPRPNWITAEFGAHNIHRVLKRFGSNIVFFNGLRDPWSGGGVLKDISKSIVAIVAKEGAHHCRL
ncbi:alpha/beta-Hydrolases superfamily protein [Abeliophyllum distichum]|uniref:Alpha/beta-Hydrolases superfamily protein n=1 Tax=Abeliophyllum distichum TaxID=126358 RepID=A0ABD1QZR8_9LAMI